MNQKAVFVQGDAGYGAPAPSSVDVGREYLPKSRQKQPRGELGRRRTKKQKKSKKYNPESNVARTIDYECTLVVEMATKKSRKSKKVPSVVTPNLPKLRKF